MNTIGQGVDNNLKILKKITVKRIKFIPLPDQHLLVLLMARKKKKKGGNRKKGSTAQALLSGMSLDELMAAGNQFLAAEKIRDALRAFKRAEKNGALPEIIFPKLFQAYLIRCQQLTGKKMFKEAEAIMVSALSYRPTGEHISHETLSLGLKILPVKEAVELYADFFNFNDPHPRMEQKLANRAIFESDLDCLSSLPTTSAINRDKDCLEKALDWMNQGQWEETLKILKPLPRKSPFSDIKIFARLMTAFGKDDRPAMLKALSMLNEDFPLTSVTNLLKSHIQDEKQQSPKKYPETAVCLWGSSIFKKDHALAFEKAVAAKNLKNIKKSVVDLASCLDTETPGSAVEFLAQVAAKGIYGYEEEDIKTISDLFQLIFKNKAKANEKLDAFFAPTAHFLNDMTESFWKNTKKTFPDKTERLMAKALVLTDIAREIILHPEPIFEMRHNLNRVLKQIGLGEISLQKQWSLEEMHLIAVKLISKAVAMDPKNRESHDLLLDLPLGSANFRKTMGPMLETMATVFPDDPRPCLRLADIHGKKGAFRKAETALKDAFKRAPHDGEVLEKYALSHLSPSFLNMKREKFELALRDLDAAEKMDVNSLGIYITEKKLLYNLLKTGKFTKKSFEELAEGLSPVEAIKLLLLFKLDLEDPKVPALEKTRGVTALFNAHQKKIKSLGSQDLAFLLKPVPFPFKNLFFKSHVYSYLLDTRISLLTQLNAEDFMDIALDLVEGGAMDLVIQELTNRLPEKDIQKKDTNTTIMAFLYTSLCHIKGNGKEAGTLSELVENAAPPVIEKLRALSRRLAPMVPNYMRPAFEIFDFTMLDMPFPGKFPFNSSGNFPFNPFEDFPIEDLNPRNISDMKERLNQVLEAVLDGGELPEMLKAMLEDDDDDFDDYYGDDDDYDDELLHFQAEKIFGSKVRNSDVKALISELLFNAGYAIEKNALKVDVLDFMQPFNKLINVLKKRGLSTSDDFRRAGKRFAENIDSAGDVFTAFENNGKRYGSKISKQLTYFIMGMKTGL